ncbi:hypothetical protein COCMIDRAFT_93819 [Bipolaris oryzae ATCC 44560]|uniref:Uncharacterized protein n=1 Tax=Bipolaris oryzae ATCC 44560 TaxID=930090 RepID=W6ZEY3_COCMI|nr:uncharacterized protein COCMIDRAFT_93819 [Bipolaris oryzae ATCC 44560]EUC46064.1 hypothetical protein COCMIDRAFT_93819 [Bipolaris oryzae ATCC 44560]
MQRSPNNSTLTDSVLQDPTTTTTPKESIGEHYRTPSPAKGEHMMSNNTNLPESMYRSYTTEPDHLPEYRHGTEAHDSAFAPSEDSFVTEDQVDQPKTPIKSCVSVPWHGLLSPKTPGFVSDGWMMGTRHLDVEMSDVGAPGARNSFTVEENPGRGIPGGENKNDGDVEMVERDAALARELEKASSPTPMRRSARLRRPPPSVFDVKPSTPTTPTPRAARKRPVDLEPPAQPEFSVVACKSNPVLFEGLPTVHSLDWQLQYPPGGSTHPSYPYPVLDPRLIFHQPFVPVVDGLPDISRVPKLTLPLNWKHVSWAGLLPIVFDPYRQAFKLTPIGPLPLTCEELRQAGLHKYVPGGELHPEYGLLPDMLRLGDGSDAEVFDFDGVDWTLPWEGQLNFHAPTTLGPKSSNRTDSSISLSTLNVFSLEISHPWREARDCPNMIIDLADGWRWLASKETDPTANFIPTPGKTRRGTGALRSNRKLKSPIPELMMLALEAEPSTSLLSTELNPILQNQDHYLTSPTVNLFCPFKSVATPVNVDITLLGDTEFTIMELLSFFPQHYYWGHAADRLARAGIPANFVCKVLSMTRALDGDTVPKSGTINSAAKNARERDVVKRGVTEEMDMDDDDGDTPVPEPVSSTEPDDTEVVASYTAEGWAYDVWGKIDYPLLALAHGLQSLPSGVDAGPLTKAIIWCRENGRHRVLLSEVPGLLKEIDIESLIEPGEAGCPDTEVTSRHAEALKKERLRLSRIAKAGKTDMEGGAEGRSKRRRVE